MVSPLRVFALNVPSVGSHSILASKGSEVSDWGDPHPSYSGLPTRLTAVAVCCAT